MLRLPYSDIVQTLSTILTRLGLQTGRADLLGRLFTDASRDGVPSHGLNRFHWVANAIRDNTINPNADPTPISQFAALERWNGNLAPGPLNAHFCMARAISLAKQ